MSQWVTDKGNQKLLHKKSTLPWVRWGEKWSGISLFMTERFGDGWSMLLKALWVCQELLILLEPRYKWQGEIDKISDCVKFWCTMGRINHILQESHKGQIFYWPIQTCSRIRRLIGWCFVTMLKKPQNCPISDFFNLTPKYFLPLGKLSKTF